jgi:peroxiredoxin (alkyl hydroperoxide reductase subunit C)
MGCDVVTVSTDSKHVHLAWREHEKELAKVAFPMGADQSGALSRTFGVWNPAFGTAERGVFLINPAGTLMGIEVNFYNVGRNIDELLRKFKANLYLSRKTSEACPSKWKDDGDKTLLPGAKLVGKVHEALQG